jgi:hypothetical protein
MKRKKNVLGLYSESRNMWGVLGGQQWGESTQRQQPQPSTTHERTRRKELKNEKIKLEMGRVQDAQMEGCHLVLSNPTTKIRSER